MKIFVSYNRQSRDQAKALADDLQAMGHTVWFDRELSGGQTWWDQILDRVRECGVFVFLLDPKSLGSTACHREFGYADALHKPILPILMTDGVVLDMLPPQLSKIQLVDYRKPDHLGLARALFAMPPAPPLPDPLPSAPEVPLSYLGTLSQRVNAPGELTYEAQATLLADLRRGLRDPEHKADAESLLKQLRRREELRAGIAEDIDELLQKAPTPKPPAPVAPAPPAPPKPDPNAEAFAHSMEEANAAFRRKDYSTAFRIATDLAKRGHVPAFGLLALCHHDGSGTPQDLAKAVEWARKGMALRDPRSMMMMGVMMRSGEGGITKNQPEAVGWLRAAAEGGDDLGQLFLGKAYNDGEGVAVDYAQALHWYRLAADQGQATAINNLGIMYLEGRGVPKDVEQAKRLFKQAIEKGVAKAKGNLAVAEGGSKVKAFRAWLVIAIVVAIGLAVAFFQR